MNVAVALLVLAGLHLIRLGLYWLSAWWGLSPDHFYDDGPWFAPWL